VANELPNFEATNGRFLSRWLPSGGVCPVCKANNGVMRTWEGRGAEECSVQHKCHCGKIWWEVADRIVV